jgi:SET domain-containing protein
MYFGNFQSPKKTHIRKSKIPGSGYGVFATHPIKKGEILECAPFIEVPRHMVFSFPNILQHYVYASPNRDLIRIVFGFGSMYNHSLDYNVRYHLNSKDSGRFVDYVAKKDIPAGGELLISYGKERDKLFKEQAARAKQQRSRP